MTLIVMIINLFTITPQAAAFSIDSSNFDFGEWEEEESPEITGGEEGETGGPITSSRGGFEAETVIIGGGSIKTKMKSGNYVKSSGNNYNLGFARTINLNNGQLAARP